MKENSSASECIFCKIANREIPAKVIQENNHAIAFLDISPLSEGHTLVIPKYHFTRFQQMDKESLHAVMEIAQSISASVEKGFGYDSTIAINNGPKAGQEVMHVHVHIIPRTSNDGAGPIHRLFKDSPQIESKDFDTTSSKIRENL